MEPSASWNISEGTKWALWDIWTDRWKWSFLLGQRTQPAAQGWAGGLQRSLTTPFSCSNTVLATPGTPWLLALPPNPSAEWGSSSQAAGHFPLCSSAGAWWGWQKPAPFLCSEASVCSDLPFCMILPVPYPVPCFTLSVCPSLSPCRHSTDNVPFTVIISLLPLKQLPGEKPPNPYEISLVTLVSSPQPCFPSSMFVLPLWAF